MRFTRNFARDERGNTFQSISLMAGAIAIAAIAGTHFLDRATQEGVLAGLPFAGSTDGSKYARAMSNLPRGQVPSRPIWRVRSFSIPAPAFVSKNDQVRAMSIY